MFANPFLVGVYEVEETVTCKNIARKMCDSNDMTPTTARTIADLHRSSTTLSTDSVQTKYFQVLAWLYKFTLPIIDD